MIWRGVYSSWSRRCRLRRRSAGGRASSVTALGCLPGLRWWLRGGRRRYGGPGVGQGSARLAVEGRDQHGRRARAAADTSRCDGSRPHVSRGEGPTSRNSRRLRAWVVAAVGAGRRRSRSPRRREPGPVGQQPQLAGRVAGGLELDRLRRARLVRHLGASPWPWPAAASKAGVALVLDLEVRRERRHRQPPAGPQRPGHARPSDRPRRGPGPTSPKAPWHSEMAASNSASKVEGPGVEPLEGRARPVAPSVARSTNRCADVDPTTSIPRAARAWAWRPGPQPTSSTRIPGSSPSASTRNATSCSVPLVNE